MIGFAIWQSFSYEFFWLNTLIPLIPWALTLCIASLKGIPSTPSNLPLLIRFFLNTRNFPSVHSAVAFSLASIFLFTESLIDPLNFSILLSCALLVFLGRIATGANTFRSVLVGAVIGMIGFFVVIIPLTIFFLFYMALGMSGVPVPNIFP